MGEVYRADDLKLERTLALAFLPYLSGSTGVRRLQSLRPRSKYNMKRVIKTLILSGAAALVLAPTPARADGFVTPWVGSAFGSNIQNGQATIGVSAGGMGAGIIGGEADFGWSPSFFGTKSDFGNNTVMDLMGNLIIGAPIGGTHGSGVRPYAVGGLGL